MTNEAAVAGQSKDEVTEALLRRLAMLDNAVERFDRHFRDIMGLADLSVQLKGILADLSKRSSDQIVRTSLIEERLTALETLVKLMSHQVTVFGDTLIMINTNLRALTPTKIPSPMPPDAVNVPPEISI